MSTLRDTIKNYLPSPLDQMVDSTRMKQIKEARKKHPGHNVSSHGMYMEKTGRGVTQQAKKNSKRPRTVKKVNNY